MMIKATILVNSVLWFTQLLNYRFGGSSTPLSIIFHSQQGKRPAHKTQAEPGTSSCTSPPRHSR